MARKINYTARNFSDVRSELFSFIRQYYPDLLSDFNDASVGTMLLELNAAVGDMLSNHTDRMYQETTIDWAQEKKSLLSLARTYGLQIPGKRPSVTIVDFSVDVPPDGDTFDAEYLPVLKQGAQAVGGGKVFESVDDIDFASDYTTGGIPNRLIIPNLNSNNRVVSYTITKRELVVNGITKIFSRTIRSTDIRPFFEIVLPESNVLSVEQIITLEGTSFSTNPTLDQFLRFDDRWWEVPFLAESEVFVEDLTRITDKAGVRPGHFMPITQKFIKEFTDKGFCKLTFGSGLSDSDSISTYIDNEFILRVNDLLNNVSLGEIPTEGTTMFIRYRIGGGSSSNVGPNILNSTGAIDLRVNGPNNTINSAVRASLTVNNPIPALGGADELTVDAIRKLIAYNFSSQNRCVTLNDYLVTIFKMPGEFGVPFRASVWEDQNMIKVAILGLTADNKLDNTSTNTLKENIANYLANYRMINDYVEINDGRIINLAFEVDLYTDGTSQSEIAANVIEKIRDYFDIADHHMNENIYLGDLYEVVNNINGVRNIVDLRVYNMVGSNYSLNEISQPYIDANTRQIDLMGTFTIFGEPNTQFEIKFAERDIRVRIVS